MFVRKWPFSPVSNSTYQRRTHVSCLSGRWSPCCCFLLHLRRSNRVLPSGWACFSPSTCCSGYSCKRRGSRPQTRSWSFSSRSNKILTRKRKRKLIVKGCKKMRRMIMMISYLIRSDVFFLLDIPLHGIFLGHHGRVGVPCQIQNSTLGLRLEIIHQGIPEHT